MRLVQALAPADGENRIDLFASDAFLCRDDIRSLVGANPRITSHIYERYNARTGPVDGQPTREPSSRLILRVRGLLKRSTLLTHMYATYRKGLGGSDAWYYFSIPAGMMPLLRQCDVLYLATPAYVEPFDAGVPVVCTLHDFNWKHKYVGNFNKEMELLLDSQIRRWMQTCSHVIFDSNAMLQELARFYPDLEVHSSVVRLSTFGAGRSTDEAVRRARQEFGLPGRFVLFPGSVARHKNTARLIEAWALLPKEIRSETPLVLTGVGYEKLGQGSSARFGDSPLVELEGILTNADLKVGSDILTPGYVSNESIDALITAASLVVSPSLYEGSAGPALDAWSAGTPLALSRIPTFLEYAESLGTEAWMFDPMDARDIARAIQSGLANESESEDMAHRSRAAMGRYGWPEVTRRYEAILRAAATSRAGS